MAYESGQLDATFSAAAGHDPVLLMELRLAFIESVERQLDLLRRARCDANWVIAAQGLKSLAASFHADVLIALSSEALDAAPGEPTVIARIARYCDEIRGQGAS